ncbi:MAG: hypothetical protein Q9N62_04200 [Ghiorsea sp.]|nr:hypothetical protein [Ghiorsea sp.]
MSSTTNAVLPVCRMNQQVIGDGKPGEIGLKIRQLMLAKIDALRAA